jgi:hypothetical protein
LHRILPASAHANKAGTPFNGKQRMIDLALHLRCFLEHDAIGPDYALDGSSQNNFVCNDVADDFARWLNCQTGAANVAVHLPAQADVFSAVEIPSQGEACSNDRNGCWNYWLGLPYRCNRTSIRRIRHVSSYPIEPHPYSPLAFCARAGRESRFAAYREALREK